jgi:hypothetical protein
MTELSNAVTVLIARMESHPDDFEAGNKFGGTAECIDAMLGLTHDVPRTAYWFLTDADKEAVTEAWKKYHYTKFEKSVMDRVFDDGAEEREAEARRLKQALHRAQMAQMAHIGSQIGAQGAIGGSYPYVANQAQGMSTFSANNTRNATLQIGNEVLDQSLLKKLKALVK